MTTSSSRLVIAGLSGDSGKTIASLSILTALRERGLSVSVFKKGPDYIDPAWLSLVADTVCRSLDTYMVDPEVVVRSFVTHAEKSDISVIEGNRGIFDGRDVSGTHSTAQLAKLIQAPVVLVVNAAKSTRTVAAIVKGCVDFDPDLNIAGVILNRVAGERHLKVLSDSIGKYSGLPVLGAIPNLGDDSALIPGRHLGLITPSEYDCGAPLQTRLREIAEKFLDIDGIIEIARTRRIGELRSCGFAERDSRASVKIGYFKDSVFTFYYPENLEALEANGAQLVPVSSLADQSSAGSGRPLHRRWLSRDACRTAGAEPVDDEGGQGAGARGPAHLRRMRRLDLPGQIAPVRRCRLPDGGSVPDRSGDASEARRTWLYVGASRRAESVLCSRHFVSRS